MNSACVLRLVFLAAGVLFLPSCSLIGLGRHVETLESRGSVTAQVTRLPRTDPAPTYALAWRMEDGRRRDSAGFHEVRKDGLVSFNLDTASRYSIGAFTDENGNRAYDSGEPIAILRDVKPLELSEATRHTRVLTLKLERNHDLPPGTVIQVPRENKTLGGRTNLALGDVVSLNEPRFAGDTGSSGLWRPLHFLTGNELGIYFTEPYDPARIPVVFVYGIGGSPQDWRWFIEHFDRKRHQLWFYHYPSGMRLDRVSGVLAEGLRLLKERHGFSKCCIVAHSMGGLVSRTALCEAVQDEGRNFIPKLVTISTPWGGHKAAESGIRHLKKPVPSWLDVTPGSDFLLRLYATPLPAGTTHDLIYGSVEDGAFWMKERNDGVVTVESETDLRIKKSTRSFRHLLHEHVSILQQKETLDLVQAALAR